MSTGYKIIRKSSKTTNTDRQTSWLVYHGTTFMRSFDFKREAIDWVMRQEARDARQKT